jgi:hypothetical protein
MPNTDGQFAGDMTITSKMATHSVIEGFVLLNLKHASIVDSPNVFCLYVKGFEV